MSLDASFLFRPRAAAIALAVCTSACAGTPAANPPSATAAAPAAPSGQTSGDIPLDAPYRDRRRPIEERVSDLLARMTVDEKLELISGKGFEAKPIPRLGIPELKMSDGPNGVRYGARGTAYPTGIALAATWDPALLDRLGRVLATETKAKGRNVLLGPCVNISRVPHNGRNFECFGEDPFLSARLAVGYVRGVQSQNVIATVKHFACNNQEHRRMDVDVRIDDRTLNEIYFPAFKAAVQEAGVWTVMSAYNKVNSVFASESPRLLNEVLKRDWAFDGFVMSDWGAVHHTAETVQAGLDLEMPDGEFTGPAKLRPLLQAGQITQAQIDDKVRRIVRVAFRAGLFDDPAAVDPKLSMDSPEARATALDVARASIVLLKNDRNVLPLDVTRLKTVAVIGPGAIYPRVGGGGSASVRPRSAVKPLDAIRRRLESRGITVRYQQGFTVRGDVEPVPASALSHRDGSGTKPGVHAAYYNNKSLSGTPTIERTEADLDLDWSDKSPGPGVGVENFSSRLTGVLTPPVAGRYQFNVSANDAGRFFLDGKKLIDAWEKDSLPAAMLAEVDLEKRPYPITVEHFEGKGTARVQLGWARLDDSLDGAVAAARGADVAIVFAGLSAAFEGEGFDRKELELPANQEAVIRAVAAANKRTIVVLNHGSPVLIENWLREVPGVIEAWYGGQEGGEAIAEALLGEINPSGRLPVTFLRKWKDSPAHDTYPGADGVAAYREGIFVGYRHYDARKLPVTFPFGHGLSYTSFRYDGLQVAPVADAAGTFQVSFDLRNTGKRAGAEVVQLYLGERAPALPRPPKELKGLQKIVLSPGEAKRVTFAVDRAALSYWDPAKKGWTARPGTFDVLVGSSSRDVRLKGQLRLP